MKASILTIGDEILIGQIVNTNSSWLAQQLNDLGMPIETIVTVGDNKKQIIDAIDNLFTTTDFIFTSGGLGPTNDDITVSVLCEYFNTSLVLNEDVFANIKQMLQKRNLEINENNKNQAMVPESATIFNNINGTAPGLMLEKNGKYLIAMPGVPLEMQYLFSEEIVPFLKNNFPLLKILHKTFVVVGISESMLAEKISAWEKSLPNEIKLAYLPSYGYIRLRLSIYSVNETIKNILDKKITELKTIISENIIAENDVTLEELLGKLLKEKAKTISTAESCTGGKIASMITSIPESSQYFMGSVVSYSNDVKTNVLKVNISDIEKYGAVSQQVVEQMATGVRNLLKTDYAIATSGIAGPDGGTPEKPVGTIWIAIANEKQVISKKYNFANNRIINVQRTSNSGLSMLIKMILASD